VIDAPGGGGKIPVTDETVLRMTPDEVVLRNHLGDVYSYPDPEDTGRVPGPSYSEEVLCESRPYL
jgi:hypothetical protein